MSDSYLRTQRERLTRLLGSERPLFNRIWALMEDALKTSYRNGFRAGEKNADRPTGMPSESGEMGSEGRIAHTRGDNTTEQPTDVAELFALAFTLKDSPSSLLMSGREMLALVRCIRDAAMEAECLGEMSGFRVTLLNRHNLTDSRDPAFGPPKYPDQDAPDPPTELPF